MPVGIEAPANSAPSAPAKARRAVETNKTSRRFGFPEPDDPNGDQAECLTRTPFPVPKSEARRAADTSSSAGRVLLSGWERPKGA